MLRFMRLFFVGLVLDSLVPAKIDMTHAVELANNSHYHWR
jgi:hypothetical protein